MKQTIYRPHSGNDFEADELLPCPFCGHIPELLFIGNDFTKKRSVEIKCTNFLCGIHRISSGIKSGSKQLALWSIEAWNKRI